MENSDGIIVEGLQVVVVAGVPRGYAGVFEPGQPANPGTEPVICVDLDTYVRLDAGEELVCEMLRELAIAAKRAVKVKIVAAVRRGARRSRQAQHYASPR